MKYERDTFFLSEPDQNSKLAKRIDINDRAFAILPSEDLCIGDMVFAQDEFRNHYIGTLESGGRFVGGDGIRIKVEEPENINGRQVRGESVVCFEHGLYGRTIRVKVAEIDKEGTS